MTPRRRYPDRYEDHDESLPRPIQVVLGVAVMAAGIVLLAGIGWGVALGLAAIRTMVTGQ